MLVGLRSISVRHKKSQAADGNFTPGSIPLEHKVRRRRISFLLKCAFSIVFALLLSSQRSATDQRSTQAAPQAPPIYRTALGERRSIPMPDGSDVVLNTSSQASVEVTARTRAMTLQRGEVLLNISRDPRPFVVQVGATIFETASPARAHLRVDSDGTTRVDVLEGEGRIGPSTAAAGTFRPIRVKSGNTFTVRDDVRILEQFDGSEMGRRLAWTQSLVILQGESLSEAVAEFNRYNRKQLIIGDESIANLSTGGTFYANEVDTFIRSLNQLFHIRAMQMRSRRGAAEVVVLVGPGYSGI